MFAIANLMMVYAYVTVFSGPLPLLCLPIAACHLYCLINFNYKNLYENKKHNSDRGCADGRSDKL